jgi:hypothetical protein
MKTDEELRKLAKSEFDQFSHDKSPLAWSDWKTAYSLAYKTGVLDGMEHTLNKLKE